MSAFSFDQPPSRRGSGSLKWDLYGRDEALPFWVADMDFASPPEVIEAVRERAVHGVYGYAFPKTSEKAAVLEYLRKRHGIEAEGSWIVWLPALVPALSTSAILAKMRGARSSITATPVYPPFMKCPEDGELESLSVLLCEGNDGRLTFDREGLEAAVRPDTGLFILCNPHNPVGRVYTRSELEWLGDFCQRHDLLLCSDEVHCDLILDEAKTPHVSLLHLDPAWRERTVVLMSASKTYNIAGIGCAFAVIPDSKLRVAFRQAMGGRLPPVNVFGYAATEAALRHGEGWRRQLIAYLVQNHRVLAEFLAQRCPAVGLTPVEATYLAWLDLRALELENPHWFFRERGLVLSNGADFGASGFLRWNVGCARSLLVEGLERFAEALENLHDNR